MPVRENNPSIADPMDDPALLFLEDEKEVSEQHEDQENTSKTSESEHIPASRVRNCPLNVAATENPSGILQGDFDHRIPQQSGDTEQDLEIVISPSSVASQQGLPAHDSSFWGKFLRWGRVWPTERVFGLGSRLQKDTQCYAYTALAEPNLIRLLELLPGSKNDVIECRLGIVRIGECRPYSALSYTWGDATKKSDMLCHGKRIAITTNLKSALRQLRHSKFARRLWVDAICINQGDIHEREHQVTLMKQIYKGAKNVIIWLGPDDDGQGKLAFTELSEYQKLMVLPQDRKGYVADSRRSRALQQFFERPWFSRVWIIQEAGLARAATVMCGHHEIDWNTLWLTAWHLTFETVMLTQDYLAGADHVMTISCWDNEHQHEVSKGEPSTTNKMNNNKRCIKFLYQLERARPFNATDSRDKVFALLGHSSALMDDGGGKELIVRPNYNIPPAEVYYQVSVRILELSHNLALLSYVQHTSRSLKDNHAPSWVPRWDINLGCKALFDAYSKSEYQIEIDKRNKRIEVQGVVFDSVAAFSEIMFSTEFYLPPLGVASYTHEANPVRKLWIGLIANTVPPEEQKKYPTGEDLEKAFRMTLTAGRKPFGDGHDQKYCLEDWYYSYLLQVIESHPEVQNILNSSDEARAAYVERRDRGGAFRFMHAVAESCHARRFLVTGKGYFGLCPAVAEDNDLICMLLGATVPFILRPTKDYYRLVGECYLYGVDIESVLGTNTQGFEIR